MRTIHRAPVLSGDHFGQEDAVELPLAFNAGASIKTILLGAALSLAIVMTAFAQSYDPDLGAGNTAPPGITYGGGLRYGVGSWDRGVLTHHAEVRHHKTRRDRHHTAR